jgi:hypothetical protein
VRLPVPSLVDRREGLPADHEGGYTQGALETVQAPGAIAPRRRNGGSWSGAADDEHDGLLTKAGTAAYTAGGLVEPVTRFDGG